jgi:hypothetical protein
LQKMVFLALLNASCCYKKTLPQTRDPTNYPNDN